jgi:hypothetical protein
MTVFNAANWIVFLSVLYGVELSFFFMLVEAYEVGSAKYSMLLLYTLTKTEILLWMHEYIPLCTLCMCVFMIPITNLYIYF